jgi:hypothetical protein
VAVVVEVTQDQIMDAVAAVRVDLELLVVLQ